ncbi:hypothetical protein [Tomitella cavernea]|uniref:hypothetical protein n=1 Tax=Tomitella cavernea TaxID=1387982 RepID=UPI003CD05B45
MATWCTSAARAATNGAADADDPSESRYSVLVPSAMIERRSAESATGTSSASISAGDASGSSSLDVAPMMSSELSALDPRVCSSSAAQSGRSRVSTSRTSGTCLRDAHVRSVRSDASRRAAAYR